MGRFLFILFLSLSVIPGCKLAKKAAGDCTPVESPTDLMFSVEGPDTIAIGNCAGPYRVTVMTEVPGQQCPDGSRIEPKAGSLAHTPWDLDAEISTARRSGTFYRDSTCNDAITSERLLAGASTFSFYFKYYTVDFTGSSSRFSVRVDASNGSIGTGEKSILVNYPY